VSFLIRSPSWLRLIFLWLRILPRPRWRELHPTDPRPSVRWQHSAVYDFANNRMVVFGGKTTIEESFNDVWVLKNTNGLGGTPSWVELTPDGMLPSERHSHSAVYDAANNRMTIFGGHPGLSPFVNDVWVLKNANGLGGTPSWVRLTPMGKSPELREWHSAVYDAANNRMIVFGGMGAHSFNDVWVLKNANGLGGTPAWVELTPTGTAPVAREGHSAVYDAANNRMVVFGGFTAYYKSFFDEVWILTSANGLAGTPGWVRLMPTGSVPDLLRGDHSAVYDAANNRMVVFGGWVTSPERYFNDSWVLTNANGLGGAASWTKLNPSGVAPLKRELHRAVYDAGGNRMVVFGGSVSASVFRIDVWVLMSANGL